MPTATVPETKAARTRRRILAAAARELLDHGFAGTSLRRVASGADLQPGSLYFHFPTKDDLLAAVIADAVDSTLARIDAAFAELGADAGARARLVTAIEVHLAALHENDRGAAVVSVVGAMPPGEGREARAHARRYLKAWLGWVEDAQAAGALPATLDPAHVRDLLIGGLNGTLRSTRGTTRTRVAALADDAVGLYLR